MLHFVKILSGLAYGHYLIPISIKSILSCTADEHRDGVLVFYPFLLIKWLSFCRFSGFQFDTEDGNKILPDFLDSIIGMKRGETKSFPYVFPDSWKQEDLRGVRAQFTVSSILFYVRRNHFRIL